MCEHLRNAVLISLFDVRDGHWICPISKESMPLTAFQSELVNGCGRAFRRVCRVPVRTTKHGSAAYYASTTSSSIRRSSLIYLEQQIRIQEQATAIVKAGSNLWGGSNALTASGQTFSAIKSYTHCFSGN
eukprot:COSAG05_NODE_14710_length_389_cov_3.213793_1_plen_129_part_11